VRVDPSTIVSRPAVEPASARLTAVIVTYKSTRTIGAALASARRCAEAGVMRTIVVDNASPDATRGILAREAAPFATVVHSHGNIGFGRGCNVGLALVETPFAVFFNPDAVMEPQAAKTIADFMDATPRCAVAGPAIHRDDGAGCQHVGALARPSDIVGDAMGLYLSMKRRQPMTPGGAPFRTDWVSGAMLVGRTEALRSLGGFDPRFFLYWEETDLCKRVLDAGHEIWAIPGAEVHHVGGVSAAEESKGRIKGCIPEHFYKSRQYYLRKHYGVLAATAAELAEVVLMPLHEGARALLGKPAKPALDRLRAPILRTPAPVPDV